MLQYTFLNHPILNIMENLSIDYSGIKNAYGLFCNIDKRLKIAQYQENNVSFIKTGKKSNIYQKFRNDAIHLSWINSDLIPFIDSDNKVINQLKIEDENDNSWLLLKYTSPIDHASDLIILEIEGIHAFGLSKKKGPATSNEKMLIGNLLNLAISSKLRLDMINYQTMQVINESYGLQVKSIEKLKDENETIKNNASKSIALFVEALKNRWENKINKKLQIEKDIIHEIIESNQKMTIIEKVFEKAVIIARNTNLSITDEIIIKKEHISWPSSPSDKISHHQFNKHSNILEFLDRYENAASMALDKGWKVNGSTVGECCDPKVSPASITFNLKKYKRPICKLIKQYDNRWPLLIAHFRPLQNILHDAGNDREENVLSA